MSDLATWLLAQLDDGERAQHRRRSLHETYGRPCPVCGEPLDGFNFPMDSCDPYQLHPCGHALTLDQMEEFAPTESRADPFVLADIAAKRRIVELLESMPGDEMWYRALTQALRLLALSYADRPGYDPAWAPSTDC